MVGTKLGSYEIIEEIGKGGMATVYRAYQPAVDRAVAVKVIGKSIITNEDAILRFQREARLIARLEHIHILPVYDFDGTHDPPYIVMRYLEGGTLRDVMGMNRLPRGEVAYLIRQVCGAVDYAHRQGIIHRDIKPSNIMVDPEGNSFVTDFGIARAIAGSGNGQQRLTQTGAAIGTPDYMAPEQGLGLEHVDHRADVYAIGVMLFEMLTGDLPYKGKSAMEVILKHAQDPVPAVSKIVTDLPPALNEVFERALAKEPSNRYESAMDLASDVSEIFGSQAVQTPNQIRLAARESQLFMLEKRKAKADEIRNTEAAFREKRAQGDSSDMGSTPPEHNQHVTAVYVNAAEYVEIVDELEGPQAAREAADEYWTEVGKIIVENRGRVFSRAEQSLLALWGAVGVKEDDPERALQAAVSIRETMQHLGQKYNIDDVEDEPLPVKIGVNTGLALLTPTNVSGEYTASGATISLANRISDMAYGNVLISYETYRRVQGVFTIEEDVPIRVRGRRESVPTFRVVGAKSRAFKIDVRGVQGVETAMIGRKAELELLQYSFQDAAEESETQFVTVISDPGLGKSRLLNEFQIWSELHPVTFRIFRGRATSNMSHRPYALLRDVLSFRFEILDSDSPQVLWEKMETGISDLTGEDSIESAHLIGQLAGFDFTESQHVRGLLDDPEQLTNRAKQLFKRFLVKVCDSMPVIIQLEDIHHADDNSLDLIAELAGENPELPLQIIVLARPELLARRPNWNAGLEYHTLIELKPLTRRESRNLVNEILRKMSEVPKKLRDEIVTHAEGNPYFMEEVIKILIEDRIIQIDGEQWSVEESRLENLRVPPTLAGLLQARIDTLLYPEKLLLQRASVVGRIFYDGALITIDRADATQLDDIGRILDTLIQREFIYRRETSAFAGQVEYIFAQQMMRDVIYDGLLRRQLAAYHVAAAQWLNQAAGDRRDEYLPLIAEHYELGGQFEEAADYLSQAAEKANLVSAIKDVRLFYDRALSILPEDAVEKRAKVLVDYGEFLTYSGDSNQAKEVLEPGLELALSLGDVVLKARALSQLGQVFANQGDFERGRVLIDEAVEIDVEDPKLRADILISLGILSWRQEDMDTASDCAEKALNISREIGDQLLTLKSLYIKSIVATHSRQFGSAQEIAAEIYDLAIEMGNRELAFRGKNSLGEILRFQGDFLGAKAAYSESLEIAREIGSSLGISVAIVNLGLIAINLQDLNAVISYFTSLYRSDYIGAGQTPLLYLVLGFASAKILQGDTETGLSWLGLVDGHPAASADLKIDMTAALDLFRESMSSEEIEAGMQSGKDLSLDEVMQLIGAEYG